MKSIAKLSCAAFTQTGECKGSMSTGVIACLQPDRRVDVEMEGIKTMTSAL